MKKGTGWKLGTIGLAGSLTMVTATLAGVGGVALNVLPVKPKDLKSEQIDYVALGDSFTSGYNAFLGENFVSFADFFAADLKNVNRLGSYKNFSKKSNLIFDVMNQAVLAGDVREALLNADVITITAGANDLVHLLEIAGMALPSIHKSHEYGEVIDEDINNGYPEGYNFKVTDAVMDLAHKIATQDFAGMMNIDETIYKDLYLAVTLNLTLLTTEIAKLAPGAQIILLSPMDPLPYMPDSMMDSPMPGNNGMSFNDVYAKLMDTYDNIAKLNPAVKHINMGEIPDYKNNNETLVIDGMEVERKHSHIADVNPSVFGHELIGNGLFKMMAPQMGINLETAVLAHGRVAEDKQRTFDQGDRIFDGTVGSGDAEDTDAGPESSQYNILSSQGTPQQTPGVVLPHDLAQKTNAQGEPLFWRSTALDASGKFVGFSARTATASPQNVTPITIQELNQLYIDENVTSSTFNNWTKQFWPIIIDKPGAVDEPFYKFSAPSKTINTLNNGADIDEYFAPEYVDELAADNSTNPFKDDLVDTFMFDIAKDLIDTSKGTATDITSFLAKGMPKIIEHVMNLGADDQYFTIGQFDTSRGGPVTLPKHNILLPIKQGTDLSEKVSINILEVTDLFKSEGIPADMLAILQLMLASASTPEFDSINKLVDDLVLDGDYLTGGQKKAIQDELIKPENVGKVIRGTDTTIGALNISTATGGKATNAFQLNVMMTFSLIREMMEDGTAGNDGFDTVFSTRAKDDNGVRIQTSPYIFWTEDGGALAQTQNSVFTLIKRYGTARSRQIFKDFGFNLLPQSDVDAFFDQLELALGGKTTPFTDDEDKAAVAKMVNITNHTVKSEYAAVEKMADVLSSNLGSSNDTGSRMFRLLASMN